MAFCLGMGLGPLNTFLSIFATSRGVQNPGFYFTVQACALLLTRSFAGRLADRRGRAFVIVPGILAAALTVMHSRIIHNAATGQLFNNQGFGGGVFSIDSFTPPAPAGAGTLTLINTLVIYNTATNGGVVSAPSFIAAVHTTIIHTTVDHKLITWNCLTSRALASRSRSTRLNGSVGKSDWRSSETLISGMKCAVGSILESRSYRPSTSLINGLKPELLKPALEGQHVGTLVRQDAPTTPSITDSSAARSTTPS
jgi:MFS family permease